MNRVTVTYFGPDGFARRAYGRSVSEALEAAGDLALSRERDGWRFRWQLGTWQVERRGFGTRRAALSAAQAARLEAAAALAVGPKKGETRA